MSEVNPCVLLSYPFFEAVKVENHSWVGGKGNGARETKKTPTGWLCAKMLSHYTKAQDCNYSNYMFITRMKLVAVSFWFLSGR